MSLSWDLKLWRRGGSSGPSKLELFQEIILPHLDAAHNLARWMMRNDGDAQDVVQESCLRAFRFFDGYRGVDGRAWLLAIVRNTCRTWQSHHSLERTVVPFDEGAHSGEGRAANQEQTAIEKERIGVLRGCMEGLPAEFREVVIMRELEEMSYHEIGQVTGLPLGTVMSRLSRARRRLEECAAAKTKGVAG